MLLIEQKAFANAVQALMIAAKSVKDQQGLRVHADIPRRHSGERAPSADADFNVADFIAMDMTDWKRIRAITLGAIIALCGDAAHVDDEVH